MATGAPSHHKRQVETALAFIEARFTEPLSLDDVSRACGMSRFHFSRIFKAHKGLTFKGYLNRRRIDRAKALLVQEDVTVTDACYDSGFNDLSYFDRVFRRLEGMSPSDYRASGQDGGTLSRQGL